MKWDPTSNKVEKTELGEGSIGAAVLTDKGNLLVAVHNRFALLDPKTKQLTEIVDVEGKTKPKNRFNDGKCDPAGRLWAGSMGPEEVIGGVARGEGSLYCLHQDKTLTRHADDISISNGLAWSSCRKYMYYIDTMKYSVDCFDYDIATGKTSNRRLAVDTKPEGLPDGMCIDAEDMLWVAIFNGGKVIRYNPRTGKKLLELKFPTLNVTSCCWGGPNLDILYVTSAKHFLSDDELKAQPNAGALFTVRGLGVKGVKTDIFKE
ncbi:putative regucalcin [Apostichopus japonicus]|uniref:Regucalcin n=1 Tax=Stichopus japonicus TaxID=307972 RepID=A0A2G8KUP9_STIJA|nr:putative regucalcin [Apostichopus japonicus]